MVGVEAVAVAPLCSGDAALAVLVEDYVLPLARKKEKQVGMLRLTPSTPTAPSCMPASPCSAFLNVVAVLTVGWLVYHGVAWQDPDFLMGQASEEDHPHSPETARMLQREGRLLQSLFKRCVLRWWLFTF